MEAYQASLPVIPAFLVANDQNLKDLEDRLVASLYVQRSLEECLLCYEPQVSAPPELRVRYMECKVCVQEIELKIRRIRYSF